MPVYMVQAGHSGPVKIGFAADIEKRLTELQVGNHCELRVLRVFEGGEAEEASLHARFSDLWLRGEWFSWSRVMLGDVGLVEIVTESEPEPAVARDNVLRVLRSFVADNGGLAAFAKRVGVSYQAAHRYLNGERIPRREILERIAVATDGRVQPNDFFAIPSTVEIAA